jgi:ferritin-like metal-binding protein YciE
MQHNERTVVVGDPAALGAVRTRRSFLRALGTGGGIVLLPSVFAACEDSTDSVVSPGVGQQYDAQQAVVLDLRTDAGLLNYAFALEQLEAAFYEAVVAAPAFQGLSAERQEILRDLRDHEVIHREFLRAAIPANGGALIGDLRADFAAALATEASILATAMAFEDLGVAAYNGAGKYFSATDAGRGFLTLAGKIVSVEARHAAAIRDVMDTSGRAFASFSAAEEASLGASNANGLDGAREPSAVLAAVAGTNLVRTAISVGNAPTPVA